MQLRILKLVLLAGLAAGAALSSAAPMTPASLGVAALAVAWGLLGPPGLFRFPRDFPRQIQVVVLSGCGWLATAGIVGSAHAIAHDALLTRIACALAAVGCALFVAAQARRWMDLPSLVLSSA